MGIEERKKETKSCCIGDLWTDGYTGDWERPDGRVPRGSCLAISAYLSKREEGTAPPRLGGETTGAGRTGPFPSFPL